MPHYITLGKYTKQGIEKIKESPDRAQAARRIFENMGAKMKDIYLVMGQYDLIVITEAPDDETVAKLTLAIGAQGNVQTETLRAFTEDEFRQIVNALPAS
jgi:uncharacterized protein with GYD domain